MAFSSPKALGAIFGAACLVSIAAPASAGPMSVTPIQHVSLNSSVTDVAYRNKKVRAARHVKVRRHYVGQRRYYYRRHASNGVPVAALGLFAGALGAAVASSSYDDCYYSSYYGCGGGYPAYSYGYGYPAYSYGYARPRYYGGGRGYYGQHRVYGGQRFYGNRGGFGGPRVAGFRGGMGGPRGGAMRMGGGGGGRHR